MAELKGNLSAGTLGGALSGSGRMSGSVSVPKAQLVKDYNQLANKPQINGVTLSGNLTSGDLQIVSENTTSGWNSNPQYLPKKGEICIYTDYYILQDNMGNDVAYPAVKIGDGNAYLIDAPFLGEAERYIILQRLDGHINNSTIHVTPEEKVFWNNKLNYNVVDEELILTRE